MTSLRVILDGDGAFPEATADTLGILSAISILPQGIVVSGASSVCVEVCLPCGRKVYGESSAANFLRAATLLQAREDML